MEIDSMKKRKAAPQYTVNKYNMFEGPEFLFRPKNMALASLKPGDERMICQQSTVRNVNEHQPAFSQKNCDIPKFFEKLFEQIKSTINNMKV